MKSLNANLREIINVYDWGFSPSQISPKTGFALVESGGGMSVWANPFTFQVVVFDKGDVVDATFDNVDDFKKAVMDISLAEYGNNEELEREFKRVWES